MYPSVLYSQQYFHFFWYTFFFFFPPAYLNGNLKLQQQLLYQRNNRTFSSGKVITIHANMTDKFSTKPFSSKVDFEYFWYKNTTLLKVTKEPFYKFMSSDSGNLTLSTLVIATLRPDRASRRDTALFQTNRLCESRKPSRLSQFNRLERERNASKCGLLEQSVMVKGMMCLLFRVVFCRI